jgi:broad specificity phosphatase PhoE
LDALEAAPDPVPGVVVKRDETAVNLSTIYIVRVGETTWEREGRQQGQLNSPLTPRGIEQARAAARTLRKLLPEKQPVSVEMSPLGRAGHTAALLCAGLDLEATAMIVSPLLIEHNLGAWQGLTNEEIDAKYPGARRAREEDKWRYVVPGGESYALLHQRAEEWLQAKRHAALTIAVTHRMVSRVLQGAYSGLTPERTLRCSHFQDRIICLHDAQVKEIEC